MQYSAISENEIKGASAHLCLEDLGDDDIALGPHFQVKPFTRKTPGQIGNHRNQESHQ